ncbi:MAG TPA: BCAM0308 family protein [Balneolales bacterium]|nr:BCAM0308 family protein [Balneolales bacterium]
MDKKDIKRDLNNGKTSDRKSENQKSEAIKVCKLCHAVYVDGRWTWATIPNAADEVICPACQRFEENQPAGIMDIKGNLFKEHKAEVLKLITETEKAENKVHPMERIMSISDKHNHTIVTTTGVNLVREIAESLRKSFDGRLEFNYQEANDSLNVIWKT